MHLQATDKTIRFISDSHLGSGTNEQEKEEILIRFLKDLAPDGVSTLYILGDLFDFWFEYETVVYSRYFHVLAALAEAARRGVAIHLVVGNHDFWARNFLEQTIGLKVHHNPIEIKLGERRVYLCHGDGLNPHDLGYRILKICIRNRLIIWFARLVHPDLLAWFAKMFSRYSRESPSVAGKLREDEGILRCAMQKFNEGIDIVIAGHSHQVHEESYSVNGVPKKYYNIGDMQERFSFLEYSRGKFTLKRLARERATDRPEAY